MKRRVLPLILSMILMSALFTACAGNTGGGFAEAPAVSEPADSDRGTGLYSVEELKNDPGAEELFFSDFSTHIGSKNLLVIIFNYNNGYYDVPDDELKQAWADYIFGTDNGELSVNGYFNEVSQGRFRFEPLLVGDNTTGVHVVHLDKDYSFEQLCHDDYPFFDFSYDAALVLDEFIAQGLDISRFRADGIDHGNYENVLIQYFDSTQEMRPSQWFDTDALMFIFPPINTAKIDLTPLSTEFNDFGFYSHICMDSSLGTIVHELCHTLGAVDVYNYCYVRNDLMSNGFDMYGPTDVTAHIDPYYKLVWGWCETQLLTSDGTVKLYPATSSDYSPVLIPTDDPNQYFLIENRRPEGYDNMVGPQDGEPDYTGLTVWRVDGLALEKIYSHARMGISMEAVLNDAGAEYELQYYASRDELENDSLINAGIVIRFENETPDYIEMSVEFQK